MEERLKLCTVVVTLAVAFALYYYILLNPVNTVPMEIYEYLNSSKLITAVRNHGMHKNELDNNMDTKIHSMWGILNNSNHHNYSNLTSVLKLYENNNNEEDIQNLYSIGRHYKFDKSLSSKLLDQLRYIVQEKIERTQNPYNCKASKKLVARVGTHGYGSELFQIALALLEAVYTGRTLILQSKGFPYSPKGWEKYHLPLSKNCTLINRNAPSGDYSNASHSDRHILHLPHLYLYYRKNRTTSGIPQDIAPLLVTLHARPTLWWHSQFMKYVTRLQPWVQEKLYRKRNELAVKGLTNPYVGIHIRRKDKVGRHESDFFHVSEYMKLAENYFQFLEKRKKPEMIVNYNVGRNVPFTNENRKSMNKTSVYKRRIYLATDDNKVYTKIQRLFPEYRVYVFTSTTHKRYGEQNLMEIIMDLFFLSEADFNVCTFSSNIGKLILEYKTAKRNEDMSSSVYSLDLAYYSHLVPEFRKATQANIDHHNNTLTMERGDILKKTRDQWKKLPPAGLVNGYNERTKQSGLYPINKTEYYIKIAEFPILH